MKIRLCAALAAMATAVVPTVDLGACTRVVYLGDDGAVVTARSMDWTGPVFSDLWLFPRGMKRSGAAGPNAIAWTSKYGSVVTAAFNSASTDGMNERGLVANLLYLDESKYATPAAGDTRRPLAITAWVQYVLDNYATVAEAVEDMRREPFYVATMMTPDGHPGQLHLSISDATGDSAIFEYLDGKLVIHHGRQYQVMTNSPPFDDQLALDAYWRTVGGNAMLPGTYRPADRFVRMAFYVKDVKKTKDPVEAGATAFSLIRNASVPIGVKGPANEPNVAETLWRTVADHKNGLYFFESTRSPNVFWVRLADVDFSPGRPAKKLKLAQGEVYAGNVAAQFEASDPFAFLPAAVK
jgi:penicillin V acylase-like amidase (Ntn superfamily)